MNKISLKYGAVDYLNKNTMPDVKPFFYYKGTISTLGYLLHLCRMH